MSTVAIIPARGGSKRIPRKNIRPFLGRPMLSYAVDAAFSSGVFDHVAVSTDDQEIADTARKLGAEIFRLRPAELSDDHTGTFAVAQKEAEFIESLGIRCDHVCVIYATVPLISPDDIRGSFEEMQRQGKSHAYPLCSYPFPIWRSCLIRNGSPEPIWPENMPRRSQDLPEAFHDAGQFYWHERSALLTGSPAFNGPETLAWIIPRSRVVDIDTQEDWDQAELICRAFRHD